MCTPSPLIPHETALLAQLASMPSLVYQREWRHPKPPHHFLAPRDCIMIQLREKGGLRVEPDPPPPPLKPLRVPQPTPTRNNQAGRQRRPETLVGLCGSGTESPPHPFKFPSQKEIYPPNGLYSK